MTNPAEPLVVVPIDSTIMNRAFWEQAADRSLKTAVQTALVFFTAVPLADIEWEKAAVAVGVTVFLTFLGSIVASQAAVFESFFIDLVQRGGRTFIATFLGGLATLETFDVDEWKKAAALAGSATLLSVVTSLMSKNIGTPGTAALLPGADLVPVTQPVVAVGAASDVVDQGRLDAEDDLRNPPA